MRRIYLPTFVITGLAAWLSWRGFEALGHEGFTRSVDAGRFQLAGPVVLGFVLAVSVVEQLVPAQRRPLLARGHRLDFGYAVFTVYACLGALPHANVGWTYGPVGRIFISPAYHRLHHAATGRLDINLGTVFALWDTASRRAVWSARAAQPPHRHRPGRPPRPVEQSGSRPRLSRTMLSQLAEPFTSLGGGEDQAGDLIDRTAGVHLRPGET